MASDADQRAMPSPALPADAEQPLGNEPPNLYAPISVGNRITGNTRVHRKRTQAQLTPGSDYNYGRDEADYGESVQHPPINEEETIGYGKSVPPTFLRRTLSDLYMETAQQPANACPPQNLPFERANANMAAVQAAAAVQAYSGGFDKPLPFAFANRMDEAARLGAQGSPYGLGAYGIAMPAPVVNRQDSAPAWTVENDAQPPPPVPQPQTSPEQAEATENMGRRTVRRVDRLRERPQPPEPFTEIPMMAEPVYDSWAAMGWKSPEPAGFENTAVWHKNDLTMFERGAFEEPPNPFSTPVDGAMPYAAPDGYPLMGGSLSGQGDAMPLYSAQGPENGSYAPYPAQITEGYTENPAEGPFAGEDDYAYEGMFAEPQEAPVGYPPPYAPSELAPKRRQTAPVSAPPAPQRNRFSFTSIGPKRAALLIACTLAIIFCMVEVGKMVVSLVANEQEMRKNREDYYALAGVDANKDVNGVELLPQGETYVPTATPVPAQTPTASPRIDQNDPLIGVMDNGGVTQTTFQAALPTATAATRTRLTQYPDNALLSISEEFTALQQENPDVMGRLTIDGVLDEVFVKRNNTFYLTHNVRGVFGSLGAVFVDESVVLNKPPENLLLRGQTSVEGKLFQPLLQYATAGGDFVAKHGIITCNTIYEQARYVIFAIVRADSVANSSDYFNYAGYPTFQSDAQMLRYVENAKARSQYTINVGVKASDRLLTLATLAEGSETKNLVILCRMLRNGETDGNIQRD